jgi:predicted nucleotidyltransferase
MKKSLAHLPQSKQDELELIVDKIKELAQPCIRKIILFGSYARGDWKDGPHTQGKGRLTIHKKSDYDILVITEDTNTARDPDFWYKITKEKLAQLAPCVKKLHQVTEKICKEKIESFA